MIRSLNTLLIACALIGVYLCLTSCSTFKDHYSIGVDACVTLCEKAPKNQRKIELDADKKPMCEVPAPRDDFGFRCGSLD